MLIEEKKTALSEFVSDPRGHIKDFLLNAEVAYDLEDEDSLDNLIEKQMKMSCIGKHWTKTTTVYPLLPSHFQQLILFDLEKNLISSGKYKLAESFYVDLDLINEGLLEKYMDEFSLMLGIEETDKEAVTNCHLQ